ncbi:DUF4233 domain-containing protein [Longispora urticae]
MTPAEPDPTGQAGMAGDGGSLGEEGKPSGLRNPGAAVRGVGAGTLVIEGIVLLLAIQPIRIMGGALPGLGIWAMVGLSVACFLLCGLLKHRWAWHVGTALQILVIGCGVFQWGIAAIGVIFLGLWLYVLNVRKSVLG